MLEDRGALPEEEGDLIREYRAMHEATFISSWLEEDVVGKAKKWRTRAGKPKKNEAEVRKVRWREKGKG